MQAYGYDRVLPRDKTPPDESILHIRVLIPARFAIVVTLG
jgi:hypothetical protein